MQSKASNSDDDDIVYVDLTEYDGPWPPPRDYGLTKRQYDDYLESQKGWQYGAYVWAFPLLAFIVPNDIYSVFPPFKWLMSVIGYVFPVVRLAGQAYSDGDKVQFVFGLTLLFALLYAPKNIRWLARRIRAMLDYNRCSVMMMLARQKGNLRGRSPLTIKQAYGWIFPLPIMVILYAFGCDMYGYVAIYVMHYPVAHIAHIKALFGGVVTGMGWYNGTIYSYVTSGRSSGLVSSDLGLLLQDFGLLGYFIFEIGVFVLIYFICKSGGYRRWKKQLYKEEKHVTELVKKNKIK